MKRTFFSALMIFAVLACTQGIAQSPTQGIVSDKPLGRGSTPAFYAYPENNKVTIRWQPANESMIDRYIIERSNDGIHFAPIRELIAGGNGGLSGIYQDADSYPDQHSNNYYRLKTVARDGQTGYSLTVTIDMTVQATPIVKPTVLHIGNTVYLDNYPARDPYMIDFFNSGGAHMASYMVNAGSFEINTSNWGKGLYFYRISDPSHPLIDAGKLMVL